MKLTPSLAGAYSGSIGGLTASHNKGGAYFRRRSVPTDPSSPGQVVVRNILGGLAQDWGSVLTDEQRAGWDTYAAAVSWVDALGQTIQLSGINHYIRSNTPRLQLDSFSTAGPLDRIDDAPAIQMLGVAPELSAITLGHAAGPPEVVTMQVEWSNAASYVSGDFVLVYVSAPMNPSIKFFKGPYWLLEGFEAENGDSGTFNLSSSTATTRYTDRFGPITTGQAVYVQLRAAMLDGRLSSRVRGGPEVVPAAA